ncbi:N-acetylmuramoyl-L-alanine amidase [Alkaliphilus hydrothermalis]|uniref:SpoIID/LytB domain protein n=1 Tax=Alkaliphilus hydrothermalis TaxID=1482730 RepID=A0ABS2NQ06_9FIRM|nr:N-acetylmuramoyl-L-alanine amidase [Alkaliphilus hydrothermalis]MBM7615022.1 SpoIID/LytB domain protein [Alkaliphilus hydrothermalis]
MKNNGDLIINIYDASNQWIAKKCLEDLIKELVAYSMPLSFHIEALKCQSIVMRTNVMKKIKNYLESEVGGEVGKGICLEDFREWKSLEEYQEIWGEDYSSCEEKINEAVKATAGVIITFNDKPIDARYHEICGGATENSENVDGNVVLYLRRVLCQYCEGSNHYHGYKDLPLEEVEEKLGIKFPSIAATDNVSIENMIENIIRDENGRVTKLKVAGKEFEGKEIRKLLNLGSTRFSWRPQFIRFLTIGKGDGVGFCQQGANRMAKDGYAAEEIIKYYYTEVDLKKFLNSSINQPLLGKVLVIDPAHGGEEGEGHISQRGLEEKQLNLEIALYLEKILSQLGAKVYLTRQEDHYVPITERAKLTNEIKPDFFLTIHQNYLKNQNVSGTEIYYYRGDQEAQMLGCLIMEKMNIALDTINRGVRTADFYLLRDIKVSGLHIEVAYLSNPIDEAKLSKDNFRYQAALAISEALQTYFHYTL